MNDDSSEGSRGLFDYWTVKIDADGTKVWDKSFGGNGWDWLTVAMSTPDGGYLLAGESNSTLNGDKSEVSRGGYDFWVVKIDADGNRPPSTPPIRTGIRLAMVDLRRERTHPNSASTRPQAGLLLQLSSDYENPQDTDGNNTYEVTLSVTDPGGLSASKPVVVSVTDQNEAPTLAQWAELPQPVHSRRFRGVDHPRDLGPCLRGKRLGLHL